MYQLGDLFWVRRRASSWVVWEPRCLWTADLVDVVVTFAVLFIGTSVGIMLIAPESSGELAKMSPDERVSAIYLQVAVSLSTIVLSTCLVLWRHGLRPRDLGWSLRAAGRDVWLGVLAFLVLAARVCAAVVAGDPVRVAPSAGGLTEEQVRSPL